MHFYTLPEEHITDHVLDMASKAFNLPHKELITLQRDYEAHVNSDLVVNTLKHVLIPLKDFLEGVEVCGYAPVGRDWEKLFPQNSPLSVNVSPTGVAYMLFNLNLFPNLEFWDQFISIQHEKVHLKQVKNGRLSIAPNCVVWEGEDWSERYLTAQTKLINENDQTLYRALPWEVEAYTHEEHIRSAMNKNKNNSSNNR
ncbi:hypothetical protein HYN57_13665 [Vibrio parahaemolyticus]|nr:hypothetical protein [Vibrio parahaemolyticus]MCF9038174.1 hypothetical protein [Vibrio parahaemolyticus]